ncbi:abscisic acid receptor PYL11-like [Phalaenopsis equestris]|uniref:abscisic acid receptor PYL11-like n=1 Tax=Phalaenopsis equestris TaxID=78828 RepID=UPI0009E2AAA9|nr:abscisic acid receptor PYL11-like [Phalaenopsis equestris]
MPYSPADPHLRHHHHHLTADKLLAAAALLHSHKVAPNQCTSVVVHSMSAPLDAVWSLLRRFDAPQDYKTFVRSCHVISGDGQVGTVRRISVVSGLPASTSTERLEILDDDRHVTGFRIVGGEHRLSNYRSVTSVHIDENGKDRTVVMESYVVDVPAGNTREETRGFVDTIVRCNLKSLERAAEKAAAAVAGGLF